MVVIDVSILWLFLGSALVVLMQAQALRLSKTNRDLAASELSLRSRNAELDAANARLSEVDAVKSRLLSGIAQEFRRPIDALISQTSLLGRQLAQSPELIERCSSAIADESAKLQRLVDSLEDRSSSDSLNLDWSETKVDPWGILEQAMAAVNGVATYRRVRLETVKTGKVSPVWAHRERLTHAIVLLIDGATARAPELSDVRCEVVHAGPEVVFRITQPLGSESVQAELDRLGIADAPSADDGGVGASFPLRLVRDIAANHHGRFWVETTPTGATAFCIALPAVEYEPRAASYDSAGPVSH